MVGILDYGLAKVADSTIKHVITPVVNRGSAIKFIEDSNQHSEEMVEATLTRITISDPEVTYIYLMLSILNLLLCS